MLRTGGQQEKDRAGQPSESQATAVDSNSGKDQQAPTFIPKAPAINLPKGGGAIHGLGEKVDINLSAGTASANIPIQVSKSRANIQPQLSLDYSSGSGNGPFGLGWRLSELSISRKTDKGLPRYADRGSDHASDVFILVGAEDLVPLFKVDASGAVQLDDTGNTILNEEIRGDFTVRRYSPRIENSYTRIERWIHSKRPEEDYWRTISASNETTIFGRDPSSRIYCIEDEDDLRRPARVFKWLASEVYDALGNAMIFKYKQEDSLNVPLASANETNRSASDRASNRYLKSIHYGNRLPNRDMSTWTPFSAADLPLSTFSFSLVFDYGDHDLENPSVEGNGDWGCRLDPFSDFRSTFELRTYRLCRRVLMFHHFPDVPLQDYLTSSMEFTYDENKTASYLVSCTQNGHSLDRTASRYTTKSLPPVDFEYSRFPTDDQLRSLVAQDLALESAENLPSRLGSSGMRWVDLDGEGLPGILADVGNAWYYKRNRSNLEMTDEGPNAHANFDPLEIVRTKPSATLSEENCHFGDVSGSGSLDLVETNATSWGYYERTVEGDWTEFVPFSQRPNIGTDSVDAKPVDLTGDGLADLLICEDQVFWFYPSLGANGYGDPEVVTQPLDETNGPVHVGGDFEHGIFLADMTGDGLIDIVRIRNGDVCYWPCLGYGSFGKQIVLDNAPFFDSPDCFDRKRILLADLDGSGTTDIVYVGADGIDLYLNQSGNSFSDRKRLGCFPSPTFSSIDTVDLFGTGTTCLVRTSDSPTDLGRSFSYVDLMQGIKPHLLSRMTNNLGSETRIHYVSSVKFYLEDQLSDRQWIARLPFPVHCVEKLELIDHISGNHFVNHYKYHHGYFDGQEREFRGFAMVEHWDTEQFKSMEDLGAANVDPSWHMPPVLTKTWFHTGAFDTTSSTGRSLAGEYFGAIPRADGSGFNNKYADLEDTVIVDAQSLTTEALQNACRALKGQILRKEVFCEDGSDKEQIPYSITESNFTLQLLQALPDAHQHCVAAVQPRESVTFQTERQLDDSRIQQELTLEVDKFGNVLKSLKIAYGRQPGMSSLEGVGKTQQEDTKIMCVETDFTDPISSNDDYRTPVACESRQYEISGMKIRSSGGLFTLDDFKGSTAAVTVDIQFEDSLDLTKAQRRRINRRRMQFRSNDLSQLLPKGEIDTLAIPGASYKLAFTPGLVNSVYKASSGEMLFEDPQSLLGGKGPDQGGYVDIDSDGHWWMPEGKMYFSSEPLSTAATETQNARKQFYLPCRFVDAFGNSSSIQYDDNYLFPITTTDALGNSSSTTIDYRVLKSKQVTDVNGNRSEFAFDALGLVAGTAVMGKPGENVGDELGSFKADLNQEELDSFFENPLGDFARTLLGSATTRCIYDVTRYLRSPADRQPSWSATLARETHSKSPSERSSTPAKFQVQLSYSDGFNRTIQTKEMAKPGPLQMLRWVTSGWTIYNNKGTPVRSFEPYFDNTHDYRPEFRAGVSKTVIYDALGREIAVLHPDHSLEKMEFTPWTESIHDPNDNLDIHDPRQDPFLGGYFAKMPEREFLPSWADARKSGQLGADERAAALKAVVHSKTPFLAHLDALGRAITSIKDNGNGQLLASRSTINILGKTTHAYDAKNRLATHADFDMCGGIIHETSMETGETWTLKNALDLDLFGWDSRGFRRTTIHDPLRRLTETRWRDAHGKEEVTERLVYGETQPQPESRNLRGKRYQVMDQAGVQTSEEYDFKGNLVRASRQLATNYKATIDWSAVVPLAPDKFVTANAFDALNRSTRSVAADGSVLLREYNEASRLQSVRANVRGVMGEDVSTWAQLVHDVEYNARSQVMRMQYGNGVTVQRTFDDNTFRLRRLWSTRAADGATLQDLRYAYDPVGNVTRIRDLAQQNVYFRNSVVEPSCDYTYDALYRLVSASGREHLGQSGKGNVSSVWDVENSGLPHPGDGNALANYFETYSYDDANNITSVRHAGSDASRPGWTRSFSYATANNRLIGSGVGQAGETFGYDGPAGIRGCMTSMPHLPRIEYNHEDQMRSTARQRVGSSNETPETTYYVYNNEGQRIRKVTERYAAEGETPTILKERIYLGASELYREYAGDGTKTLERETLEVMGESERVAFIETRALGDDGSPAQMTRYQFGNLIQSSVLELDSDGNIISYEEYSPFGSTTYQAVRSALETPKRYRYSGKERDEESGLSYFGARYYAAWLCRWTCPDPLGDQDGPNRWEYVKSNPVRLHDAVGTNAAEAEAAAQAAAKAQKAAQLIENAKNGRQAQQALAEFIETMRGPVLQEKVAKAGLGGSRIDILVDAFGTVESKFIDVSKFIVNGKLDKAALEARVVRDFEQSMKHMAAMSETQAEAFQLLKASLGEGKAAEAVQEFIVYTLHGAPNPEFAAEVHKSLEAVADAFNAAEKAKGLAAAAQGAGELAEGVKAGEALAEGGGAAASKLGVKVLSKEGLGALLKAGGHVAAVGGMVLGGAMFLYEAPERIATLRSDTATGRDKARAVVGAAADLLMIIPSPWTMAAGGLLHAGLWAENKVHEREQKPKPPPPVKVPPPPPPAPAGFPQV